MCGKVFMIETGNVVEVLADGRAVVEVNRREACGSCNARGACNPAAHPMVNRTTALTAISVSPGDKVEIEIADGAVLTAVTWAYLVPAALLIAGVFAVWYGADGTSLDASKDMLAAVGGLAGAGIGFAVMRIVNNRIRKPGTRAAAKFVVRVVRIVDEASAPTAG